MALLAGQCLSSAWAVKGGEQHRRCLVLPQADVPQPCRLMESPKGGHTDQSNLALCWSLFLCPQMELGGCLK